MLKIKLKGIPLLLFVVGCTQLKAQKAILSSGNDATGSGGSVSYSIGQLDYAFYAGSGGAVLQGVQVPFVSTSLPISLLNLKATRQEDKVMINWQTENEINSHYFIVQRSNNGVNFIDLDQVPAAGNSSVVKNYITADSHPVLGVNFYRIKEVDKDGTFILSKVISVNYNQNEWIAMVYPNPANSSITLKTTNLGSPPLTYKLFNSTGQLVLVDKIVANLTVIKISSLAPSNYLLKIIDNNKTINSFKIIKTK